jgi:ribonucleoside-diphosphate reductase alpha chain
MSAGATQTTTVTASSVTQELVGSAGSAEAVAVETAVVREVDTRLERVREARMKGYEGDSCAECGNFTLVRNGTCLKCATCGSTSGCS